MEKLRDAVDALRAALEHLPILSCIAALTTGAMLLGPPEWARALRLDSFVAANGRWLGLTFTVSLAALVVTAVQRSWAWAGARWAASRLRRELPRTLAVLSPEERGVIGYCLLRERPFLSVPLGNPTAHLMESRGLLAMGPPPCMADAVPYHIRPEVWEAVRRSPAPYVAQAHTIVTVAAFVDGESVHFGDFSRHLKAAIQRWNSRVREQQELDALRQAEDDSDG